MRDSRKQSRFTLALYLNAGAIALLALAVFSRSSSNFPSMMPAAMAQNQLPIGGGAGVFIVPAQYTSSTYGCYIMDVDAQTLCAYQYMPTEHNFRLVAARTYRYDRKLVNFNTQPPPNEIKALIEKEAADARAMDQRKTPPSPEAPDKGQ